VPRALVLLHSFPGGSNRISAGRTPEIGHSAETPEIRLRGRRQRAAVNFVPPLFVVEFSCSSATCPGERLLCRRSAKRGGRRAHGRGAAARPDPHGHPAPGYERDRGPAAAARGTPPRSRSSMIAGTASAKTQDRREIMAAGFDGYQAMVVIRRRSVNRSPIWISIGRARPSLSPACGRLSPRLASRRQQHIPDGLEKAPHAGWLRGFSGGRRRAGCAGRSEHWVVWPTAV
jgi:hypothetical protein